MTSVLVACAQKPEEIIVVKEVERIERVLASDEMAGRKINTPGIEKAADFIESEFRAIGLKTWDAGESYRQKFTMIKPKQTSLSAMINGTAIDQTQVVAVTCNPELKVDKTSGFEKKTIAAGDDLINEAMKIIKDAKNAVVFVDTTHTKNFRWLGSFKRSIFKTDKSVVFILGAKSTDEFVIDVKHEISEQKLSNVVGMLPGKSKKDEYVIFSGHYDHLGIGKPVNGDSIYNGANDDAAGITGVIMLAKYFKALKSNERTIIFAAFTAEESGGFGSQYFSRGFDSEKVMAMFNIEMIGTESKWGKNSAYITGFDKTDMGAILQKNLATTDFTFHPDPYTQQQLFYRSDNATLARLGVPAHTISTAKMEDEPNYHKVSDHVETLDLENMTRIIRSIALSSKSIVAGKDTPSRVNVADLK
jgi:hypothetical protein